VERFSPEIRVIGEAKTLPAASEARQVGGEVARARRMGPVRSSVCC